MTIDERERDYAPMLPQFLILVNFGSEAGYILFTLINIFTSFPNFFQAEDLQEVDFDPSCEFPLHNLNFFDVDNRISVSRHLMDIHIVHA